MNNNDDEIPSIQAPISGNLKDLQKVSHNTTNTNESPVALLSTPSQNNNNYNNINNKLSSLSTSFVSYSSVASSQLSPNATPFEYHPKVVLEDSSRTQFVAPLRILNRPNARQDQSKDLRPNVDVKRQLQKSFEEKQAEYAKARLRILGEEMPVENLNLDVSQYNNNDNNNNKETETL